jgi:hypothetical protein
MNVKQVFLLLLVIVFIVEMISLVTPWYFISTSNDASTCRWYIWLPGILHNSSPDTCTHSNSMSNEAFVVPFVLEICTLIINMVIVLIFVKVAIKRKSLVFVLSLINMIFGTLAVIYFAVTIGNNLSFNLGFWDQRNILNTEVMVGPHIGWYLACICDIFLQIIALGIYRWMELEDETKVLISS